LAPSLPPSLPSAGRKNDGHPQWLSNCIIISGHGILHHVTQRGIKLADLVIAEKQFFPLREQVA
jgi:hypothetical protein